MSIDIRAEVTIQRPRTAVAAYMFDPRNEAVWTTGVVESKPLTDGPMRKGTKVERVSKFMGRQFPYVYEVTDTDADSFVEIKVDNPFPMRIRYELSDAPEGTRASIRASGDATGFFKMAAPLMSRMVKRNIQNDLELLKEVLEAST